MGVHAQDAGSPLGHRRFTADEVLRMTEAGIFGEDDRIELVGGEVLEVSPQGPDHRSLKDELHAWLARAYAATRAHILNQGPLRAGTFGLPEPDLAVVSGSPRDYLDRHPAGRDTLLVIEIAKSSQERDRLKAADYARGGVPVYWLLDLDARRLDIYTDPDPEAERYRQLRSLGEDESAELPIAREAWDVRSLLP